MIICDECETVAHCAKHGCIPKQPAPVQEPGTLNIDRLGQWLDASLKERAAQRQWVGLTDDERKKLWRDVVKWGDPSHDDVDLIKAIEAKLKEKNHG